MKKFWFTSLLILGVAFGMQSQEISKNAIGLRLGDNDGFGGEISYQRHLGGINRLELDLGWRNSTNVDAYKLVGLYQWVWNIEGGFNWYAGFGGGVGSWRHDRLDRNGSFFLAAGNIGIEYNFDIPLLLSLDFRPEVYFGDGYGRNDFGPDIALGIRFQF